MPNTMLFYRQITPLSRDSHRNLKLRGGADYGFAAHTHWLPVAGTEFYQASRSIPIVFVTEGRSEDGQVLAVLLVGLEHGGNDYVSADMQWKAEAYVPAFVRRYPFMMATAGGEGEEKPDKDFTVCFDAAFPGFGTEEGVPLFNADGSAGALLEEAVQFMNGFQNDLDRTREFIGELRRLDLLKRHSADVRGPDGRLFQVKDILIVDEKKFSQLTGPQLASLHEEGFLGWIFAHLMSLANLPALLELHMAKNPVAKNPAAENPKA